ncbi:hypothetical protein H5410_047221 [Solanum commersonii]|uniref:Uncharacterized protein n=1 Tax=Solanum commersonii TaxID=4109 RepID=A0A9J5XEI9_SOLCO|nr:hypothetical protein H5410_047221 [Solanum commersonii]
MFKNIFIVAKNMLRRAIQRSKLGSSINSAICHLVISIAFLPCPSAFSRAWHTGTLGGQMATRRLAKWTWRSPYSLFFLLSAHFVPFCKLVSLFCSSIQVLGIQGFCISY